MDPGRQQRRIDYLAYIESAAWRTRRFRWLREHRVRTGKAATCQVGGAPDDLELHHHDYTRLGHEQYDDLAGLCHGCHQLLHDIYDASRHWRRLNRPVASRGIITSLRAVR